ncbi:MAG: helix-turn-helix transcriptional regulator [Phycisphaeraceae bacterium]
MSKTLPTMQMVIGLNAHELRIGAGLTLDRVSAAARRRGLKWSESRVADFEAGRVAPSLPTLLAVCLALNDAGCAEATLPLLVKYISPVRINDSLALLDVDVVRLLAGQPVDGPEPSDPADAAAAANSLGWKRTPFERRLIHRLEANPVTVARNTKGAGATEGRIGKSLQISPQLLAHLSAALWDRSFSAERDRRAGDDASAQKRGRVSRDMQAELKSAIKGE